MRLVSLVLFLFSGCGIHVSSDPVQVNHTISIDFQQVALYCQGLCTNEPDPKTCEETCFTNTVNSIMSGVSK